MLLIAIPLLLGSSTCFGGGITREYTFWTLLRNDDGRRELVTKRTPARARPVEFVATVKRFPFCDGGAQLLLQSKFRLKFMGRIRERIRAMGFVFQSNNVLYVYPTTGRYMYFVTNVKMRFLDVELKALNVIIMQQKSDD